MYTFTAPRACPEPVCATPAPNRKERRIDALGDRTAEPVRILFVTGAMRSGSTLLTRLLGQVEGLFGAGELFHFFGRALRKDELCSCGLPARACPVWSRVIARLVDHSGGLEGFRDGAAVDRFLRRASYGRHLPAAAVSGAGGPASAPLRRFRSLLGRLYRAVRDVTGARVLVDASKLPAYGWLLRNLRGVDLTLIHLVRDARGVVHSWSRERRRPGAREEVAHMNRFGPVSGALLWSVSQAGAELLRLGAADALRFRYEDLARDPEAVVRRVLGALDRAASDRESRDPAAEGGESWTLDHLEGRVAHLDEQHLLAGNPMRMSSGRIAIQEDRAWRERMSAARRRVVTALTFPFLRRYGMTCA